MRLKYVDAIREATIDEMNEDPSVILIGEGVPDPKCVFGSTKELQQIFGKDRVFDMPVSENGMTGVCIGAAIAGLKPILVHQRIDFSLYAMDQLVNNAAKWYSMYGGQAGSVPMVVRCIIGRGWGQGNQHSQCLSHLYAMIPGLKVVTPANAKDAYFLFRKAIRDPGPVVFIEHRWLHNTESDFTKNNSSIDIGEAKIIRKGKDITIVAWSYMVIEALKAREELFKVGITAEIVDLRTIRPLDIRTVKQSLRLTKRLLVLEESWSYNSLASEIITQIIEEPNLELVSKPLRITLPDCYAPSTPHLSKYYYPTTLQIVREIINLFEIDETLRNDVIQRLVLNDKVRLHDVPDESFKGPF